jgi:hypothetical protein
MMQLIRQLAKLSGKKEDTFRFQRAADARNGSTEMRLNDALWIGIRGCRVQGTFQNVSQQESCLLEFGQNRFLRLPFLGNLDGAQNEPGLTLGGGFRTVKKFIVSLRSNSAEQKRLNVKGTETRRPFQPLKAAGDVIESSGLPAAITGQLERVRHLQRKC